MVTMQDIAAEAGVSVSTVSHVLNKTRRVDPKTAAAVEAAIQRTAYTPNSVARALVRASTRLVGVAISAISNHYFAEVAAGIEQMCAENGRTMLLADTHDIPEDELRVVRTLHERRPDGVILAPAAGAEQGVLAYLRRQEIPTVLIDRCTDAAFDQVAVENENAVAGLVAHLASHSHRRIGFVCGQPGLATTDERLAGYHRGLTEAGLRDDPALVVCGNSQIAGAREAADRLLDLPEPPTALIAANNLMTIGTLRAVRNRGLTIPADVAFAGFDDFDWSEIVIPRLTVLAQPCEQIGRQAMMLLLRRLEDRSIAPCTLRLPPVLHIRELCGCGA